jgi:ferric-dicitrate binding protein FerR (iron transport regulator)
MKDSARIRGNPLLESLAAGDVLDKFDLLPEADRAKFLRWVERSTDDESRWRRINALVLAMRLSPLVTGGGPATGHDLDERGSSAV